MTAMSGSATPTLTKLAEETVTNQNTAITFTLTDEVKEKCSEVYVVVNMTLDVSTQLNILGNGANAQDRIAQFTASATFENKIAVVALTKEATINGVSVSRYMIGVPSAGYKSSISYIGVRPNSGTAKMTGTVEFWGWL